MKFEGCLGGGRSDLAFLDQFGEVLGHGIGLASVLERGNAGNERVEACAEGWVGNLVEGCDVLEGAGSLHEVQGQVPVGRGQLLEGVRVRHLWEHTQ